VPRLPTRPSYDNFIGGKWVPPVQGRYFDNITPITGQAYCQAARSSAEDIELALDAAHAAADAWGRTSVAERALLLNRIAGRIDANLEALAYAETVDNGKPIRETLAADIPLAADHFRYFAGCIRAQEGTLGELDENTVAYHFHEPLGVVGQIIPWNFPILMAAWKVAPALAAGNCVVLKPAEQTPTSILVLMELIADILPPGVLNVVNGFGLEAGKPLASNRRIAKIAFTGETTTGRLIMQYASQNLIPVTLELGGKSPNVFFADVADADDDFFDKSIEGFVLFAFNQGEVCTCPSRALIPEPRSTTEFMERAIEAGEAAITADATPWTPTTHARRAGLVASSSTKIMSYHGHRQARRAPKCLTGGGQAHLGARRAGRRLLHGAHGLQAATTSMRIFQEEIFGPVAVRHDLRGPRPRPWRMANDTLYGLGAGVWTPRRQPWPTAWAVASRPAACGPTATTPTPRTRRSAVTSSPASAARRTG
jgi:aldehyde dehydrogenase